MTRSSQANYVKGECWVEVLVDMYATECYRHTSTRSITVQVQTDDDALDGWTHAVDVCAYIVQRALYPGTWQAAADGRRPRRKQ